MEIDQLKQKLPLPDLMSRMGFQDFAVASCCSPFREDKNPSWGIFQRDGIWLWKDHGTDQAGDEITFIQEALNLSKGAAIKHYRRMCGIETVEATIDMTDPPIDWQAAVAAFTPKAATHLQKWRDYSPTFVQWLKDNRLVGIINSRLAFPIQHDPTTPLNGKTNGAHLLNTNRDGWSVLGGKTMPLLIGENTTNAFIFESQWDAFAWMDRIEWYKEMLAVSCVVITRGASNGRLIHGLLPSTARIYLVPQNDPLNDKGESPATKWVQAIAKLHPRCLIVATPPEYKDLNEWTQSGASKQDLTAAGDEATHLQSSSTLPPIISASELLSTPPIIPPELIHGLLHQGSKMIMGGASKGRKSWMLLDLAVCVSTGKKWWGFDTTQGSVLFLNLEIQPAFICKRLEWIRQERSLDHLPDLNLWNLRGYAASMEELALSIHNELEKKNISMLILDPLYKVLGSSDENANTEMALLMNQLESIAVQHSCAVVFAHHHRKGQPGDANRMDLLSGAGTFARDPDSIVTMLDLDIEGEDCVVVDPVLRNFPPQEPFGLRWECPLFHREEGLDLTKIKGKGGPKKKFHWEDAVASLPQAEWIEQPAAKKVVQEALKCSDDTAIKLIKEGVSKGKVRDQIDGNMTRYLAQ